MEEGLAAAVVWPVKVMRMNLPKAIEIQGTFGDTSWVFKGRPGKTESAVQTQGSAYTGFEDKALQS